MSTNTANYIIHKGSDLDHSQTSWLNSYHTFSFSHFYDPQRMGFRALRVINDNFIAANAGFPTHGHRDMEILTYVLSGAVEHQDSLGTGSIIRAGEVQIMSAGTGISHSEFNPSSSEELHLLQIWILPDTQSLKPRYEQKEFNIIDNPGSLQLIAAKDGDNGAITIHQDVNLYAAMTKITVVQASCLHFLSKLKTQQLIRYIHIIDFMIRDAVNE
ncbi:pirin family protein [Anabaena sp. FACHB-1237]|uniref:pirin family protein n=1 Tax=Anabaena sp. FACHB-1237 TaxID=2692769 RepID=UPI00168087BC|nr:pirin-like bicupin family protein [Anabaena sp. FACHB-1237]MBD2138534.1 pirin family protein [Anabaena sp. FACHB-1237]